MINFFAALCLLAMLFPPSLGLMIFYPFSDKLALKCSDYIEFVCGPRLWRILHFFKNFNFFIYDDKMDELPEQFIIVSNHQSLLDIPCFMNVFQNKNLRFVAKDALGNHVPMVSKMLKNQKHCLVPRKAKPLAAMEYIEKFGKRALENNQIPVIFPEGTRTKDGEVGKFYSAGFRKLAESTGLPVVVCAIEGGYNLRDFGTIFTKLDKGCYRVKVLKVYDNPATKEDCISILEESRVIINDQVHQWREIPSTQK